MIHVTERAEEELKRISVLFKNALWVGASMRLMDRGEGDLGVFPDVEVPGDRVLKCQGNKVLVVEPKLANHLKLKEVTIDVDETPEGPVLVVSAKRR